MGKMRDRSQFYFTMATVLDAGASPVSALRHEFLGKFKKAAAAMYGSVSDGGSLSNAMSTQRLFSSFECILVAIGERSGKLPLVLRTLGEWYDIRHSMRQHVVSGMLYPLFLYFFAGIVFSIVNYFIDGIGLGTCLMRFCIWTAVPVLLFVAAKILKRQVRRSSGFGRFVNHVPVIGELFFKQESMVFFKTLGICISSGMGMAYSLRNAGKACGSAYYRKRYSVLADMVDHAGCPLTTAFRRMGLSRLERRSVIMDSLAAGEESGTLDEACARIAELHREDSIRLMNVVSRTIPLLFYLLIAIYIGIRIISFFAGYVNIINGLME